MGKVNDDNNDIILMIDEHGGDADHEDIELSQFPTLFLHFLNIFCVLLKIMCTYN